MKVNFVVSWEHLESLLFPSFNNKSLSLNKEIIKTKWFTYPFFHLRICLNIADHKSNVSLCISRVEITLVKHEGV